MMPDSLEASIHQHFGFLLSEHGFTIAGERYRQEMGNAILVFTRPPTLFEVVKDRGRLLITLGDERLDRRDWVEFAHAVRCLSGSTDPVYSFPSIDNTETQEAQVAQIAARLRRDCAPLLRGEWTVVQLKADLQAGRRPGSAAEIGTAPAEPGKGGP